METTNERDQSFFMESVQTHQRLVDMLVQAKNADGISHLSQLELAEKMNRSQTWVSQAIKRLNTEEICLKMVSHDGYTVQYTNILEQGVFFKIMLLITESYCSSDLIHAPDKVIADERGLKLKTVQMFKSYLRSGWKRAVAAAQTRRDVSNTL